MTGSMEAASVEKDVRFVQMDVFPECLLATRPIVACEDFAPPRRQFLFHGEDGRSMTKRSAKGIYEYGSDVMVGSTGRRTDWLTAACAISCAVSPSIAQTTAFPKQILLHIKPIDIQLFPSLYSLQQK